MKTAERNELDEMPEMLDQSRCSRAVNEMGHAIHCMTHSFRGRFYFLLIKREFPFVDIK